MTDNQVRAIKRLQALSWNDDEFRTLTGFRDMTFKDVISCGFWSLEDLEDMGSILNNRRCNHTFRRDKGKRHPRKRVPKAPLKSQLLRKAYSLNKRDGRVTVIRR